MWHLDLVNNYARYCGVVDGVVYLGKYNGEEFYGTRHYGGYNVYFVYGKLGPRIASYTEVNDFLRTTY